MFHHDHSEERLASSPLSVRVLHALTHTMQAQRQLLSLKVGELGTHPGQSLCMREIAHNEGISQRDLAAKLQLSRPTVTVMVQKLERSGLIKRRVNEKDQRFTHLYLTDKGRQVHEGIHEVLGELVQASVASMSEDDQRELERLLNLLTANITHAIETHGRKDES